MVKYDRNTLFQVSASWDVSHHLFLRVKLPIIIVLFSHVMSSKTYQQQQNSLTRFHLRKCRWSGANWRQRQNSVNWKNFLRSKLEYISWTLGCIAPDFGFTKWSLTGKIISQSRAVWKAIMVGLSKRYDVGSWLDSLKGLILDHGWTVWKVWFGIMAGQSERYDLGSWLDSLKGMIWDHGWTVSKARH